jgi:hypothetical protein
MRQYYSKMYKATLRFKFTSKLRMAWENFKNFKKHHDAL